MKRFLIRAICFGISLFFWTLTGCNKAPVPPTPLAAEQLVPELQKAFARAQPPTKDLVEEIVSAVQTNGFADAFQKVQLLAGAPGITKEQRLLSARAMLTINGQLQTAQAQGDQTAAATLKSYQRNK